MKKIYTIICLALVMPILGLTGAQAQSRHEFSVQGGLGLSTLNYSLEQGERKGGFGGTVGFGYNYHINSQFSIKTGAELAMYNAKAKIGSLTDSYGTTDSEGRNYLLRSTTGKFEEKQNAMFINIPIMLQYELPVFGEHRFYAALGAKIGIPASSKYKSSGADIKVEGYYENLGWVADEDFPFEGFGNFTSSKADSDLNFKLTWQLSAEVGIKWDIKSVEGLSLYTGIYCDYGLNNIRKDKSENFLSHNVLSPKVYVHNSVINSVYTTNPGATNLNDLRSQSFTDKVKTMAVGLKVGVAFRLPSSSKTDIVLEH